MPRAWLLGLLLDNNHNDLLEALVGRHAVKRLHAIPDDYIAAEYADTLIRRSHWTMGIALDYHRLMPEA